MIGPARLHPARSLTGAGVCGLLDRRFRHLSLVYDERFAHTYGPWRAVVPAVVDRLLACHAKRLARWTLWGSRLRPYCLYRRALIGNLARLAARIVTAGVRAAAPCSGSSCAAADRSFALRHGRCVAETAALAGRTARTAPGFAPASLQLAPDWPTAGTAALEPPLFLARLLTHIPDPGQVMTRYYGWYASRTRGTRARLCPCAPVPLSPCAPVPRTLPAPSSRLLASGFSPPPLTDPLRH